MVDSDLLRRKTGQILHHTERLRRNSALTARELRSNEDLYNTVLMDLQQAIQACLDLAIHACVDDNLGAPTAAADALALLARAGRIDEALQLRLTGAAGLRNLIVHQYVDIDAEKILFVIQHNLDDLTKFATRMQDY
jgi:uncharacterized protein YutE (UPF0331/DUF86 family)